MYPILAALLIGATPGAGPLTAAAPSADRGEVRTGPPLVHTFDLAHRGSSGSIIITAVEAPCGCLAPTVSREVLRPGESAKLTLAVNTLTQPPGPHVWRTVVRYRVADGFDGPAPPAVRADSELELRLSARLIQEVSVSPPALAVSTSSETTQSVSVTDRRANPLTVRAASTTSPHLTAAVRPATTSAGVRTQLVDVTVGAEYPTGLRDETLVLHTTDPACPELRVPVRVTKRSPGAVSAVPEVVEVRFARGQSEASGLVQLRRSGGGVLKVVRAECDHPAVRVRWADVTGPVATVRVVIDRVKAGGQSGHAEVRVVTAEPGGEPVLVPVTWSLPD
jgi:hypothetical protein